MKETDYEKQIKELKQELEIRTEQNAELYANLCNALMEIERLKKLIESK